MRAVLPRLWQAISQGPMEIRIRHMESLAQLLAIDEHDVAKVEDRQRAEDIVEQWLTMMIVYAGDNRPPPTMTDDERRSSHVKAIGLDVKWEFSILFHF